MRRLLLVPTPQRASLAPIYLSLLFLAWASLLGLLVAVWPLGPTPVQAPPRASPAAAGGSFEGRLLAPPEVPKPHRTGTWM